MIATIYRRRIIAPLQSPWKSAHSRPAAASWEKAVDYERDCAATWRLHPGYGAGNDACDATAFRVRLPVRLRACHSLVATSGNRYITESGKRRRVIEKSSTAAERGSSKRKAHRPSPKP